MYLLCEQLRVLPNGGGLLDQAPATVERIMLLHRARDERARAQEEQEKRGAKSS